MTGIVVSDAGPLIALSRIDRLALLNALCGSVVVPTAVFSGLRVDSDRPGTRTLSAAFAEGAIHPRPLAEGSEDELSRLSWVLDPGEASATLLAEQLQARFLLIDEPRGRQVARARGLRVVSVAGVLSCRQTGRAPGVSRGCAGRVVTPSIPALGRAGAGGAASGRRAGLTTYSKRGRQRLGNATYFSECESHLGKRSHGPSIEPCCAAGNGRVGTGYV